MGAALQRARVVAWIDALGSKARKLDRLQLDPRRYAKAVPV